MTLTQLHDALEKLIDAGIEDIPCVIHIDGVDLPLEGTTVIPTGENIVITPVIPQ